MNPVNLNRPVYLLRDKVASAFEAHFGVPPTCVARAPGRVNIIGEHTDYNGGFVLPAAIQPAIYIAGKLAADPHLVTIHSLDFADQSVFTLDQLEDPDLAKWSRYLRGVLYILREERGVTLRGLDLCIVGDVPLGAGFSSSAAVEVAMLTAVNALYALDISKKDRALLGQRVENRFIGVPSGIMDQMISALGEADHALLLDCRSLEARTIPIPAGVTLMACDTGTRHELANSEYGTRRAQCEEAARVMGVELLRDATHAMLEAAKPQLAEVVYHRALHVITEDQRTLAAVDALASDDLAALGQLVNASHASLRDLYEVTNVELNIMASIAQTAPGCFGARMMGGGFGGAVIALVADDQVAAFSAAVGPAYQAQTGITPHIYQTKAMPGTDLV